MAGLLGSWRRRFWGREPVGIEEEEGGEKKKASSGEDAFLGLADEAGKWAGRMMGRVARDLEEMKPGSRSEPYLLAVMSLFIDLRKTLIKLLKMDSGDPLHEFGFLIDGLRERNLDLRCKSALPRDAALLADAVDAGILTLERLHQIAISPPPFP